MKILENTTAYKCEYCGKVSLSKGGLAIHEKRCRRNPVNQSICTTCKWCKKVMYDINFQPMTDFICMKDGSKMYSPKIMYRNKVARPKIIERCDRPMANALTGCENYEFAVDGIETENAYGEDLC